VYYILLRNTNTGVNLKKILDKQQLHWGDKLASIPDMFGKGYSESARKAKEVFKKAGVKKILELGGGQGRDTIFFAQNGFQVYVLDYSEAGIKIITEKVRAMGLSELVIAKCHDVRAPLPFEDASFDGCYSHLVYCMALTTSELECLSDEIRRILKLGGINIYTARNTEDPLYKQGIHRGEDMYEMDGFIVHYFSAEKIWHLSKGFEIISIDRCEESRLPRRLFRVTLKKTREPLAFS